jgi:hypothetical protein
MLCSIITNLMTKEERKDKNINELSIYIIEINYPGEVKVQPRGNPNPEVTEGRITLTIMPYLGGTNFPDKVDESPRGPEDIAKRARNLHLRDRANPVHPARWALRPKPPRTPSYCSFLPRRIENTEAIVNKVLKKW